MRYTLLLSILFCAAHGYCQPDLQRGLIAYYPFEGNARNAVSNEFHGNTHGNLQLTADRFGQPNKAYRFNGSNTNIVIRDNGPAATFNSGVFYEVDNSFFGTMRPLGNSELDVPVTYIYPIKSPPQIRLNEWYCVVNTFDQGYEKIYLNGELVRDTMVGFEQPTQCSNTDFIIGSWWKNDPRWFKGTIDDVRIYDRPITNEEVRQLFAASSDSLVINHYAAVTGKNDCDNNLFVENATDFHVGDTVLLIQMQGAIIDTSNTANFGSIINYGNSGNYEFNIVSSISGNKIALLNSLERTYDFQKGKVQLVRVPFFENYRVTKPLTARPWNGSTGGVLAFNVGGTLTLDADIDVTGKGFRHGAPLHDPRITSNAVGYYYNASSNNGGEKGEGIAVVSTEKKYGRGALANGGGGGNAHNAGGGGGSNGGAGGRGGDQYEPLKSISEKIGGKGGYALANSGTSNRLFMGGAGGMGQANNDAEFDAGNGGGIVVISAGSLVSNTFSIKANGAGAIEAPRPDASKDGMSGGGGGGSILLNVTNTAGAAKLQAKGGKGADQIFQTNPGKHGPGGGGGGGVIAVPQASVPAAYITDVSGGINGRNIAIGNDPWDAQPGSPGMVIPDFRVAKSASVFTRNIDSLTIKDSLDNCQLVHFSNSVKIKGAAITTWQWTFGDGTEGTNAPTQNHDYKKEGTFTVKLIVTDANGCIDSTVKEIKTYSKLIQKSADTSICENTKIKLFASGGVAYHWTPTTTLDRPDIAEPVATPAVTTTYQVAVTKAPGCIVRDSVLVTVKKLPVVTKTADTTICFGTKIPLTVTGGNSYKWTGNTQTLSNPNIGNPIASPIATTTYHVVVTSADGCPNEDSIHVVVQPVQRLRPVSDTVVCKNESVNLSTTGGVHFSWTPQASVLNPSAPSTQTLPLTASTTFHVEIKDNLGCISRDSVSIRVRPDAVFTITPGATICKNDAVTLTASGGDTYLWSPVALVSNPGGSTVKVSPPQTTTFSVIVSESTCNTKDTLYSTIAVNPLPQVKAAKEHDVRCDNPSTRLSATGTGASYLWSPSASLDRADIANPIASPKETTVYVVTTTDAAGCSNSDSVTVIADPQYRPFTGMPDAFTPNGDGLNDCFGVKHLGSIENLDFRIYNRLGQIIFKTNNPSQCWDGTFKGKQQGSGAFAYVVSGKTPCGDIQMKGSVVLIR